MGPDQSSIEQVKLDAHKATLRHFRDDAEDNGYKPAVPFDEVDRLVRNQLTLKAQESAPGTPAADAPEQKAKK